jgi:hypothetical protein
MYTENDKTFFTETEEYLNKKKNKSNSCIGRPYKLVKIVMFLKLISISNDSY